MTGQPPHDPRPAGHRPDHRGCGARSDLLPLHAAGSLPDADRDRVSAHLAGCPACRDDLAAWSAIADAAAPAGEPPDPALLVRSALARSVMLPPPTPTRRLRPLAGIGGLMVAEARLIRLAVPLASALVLGLGIAVVALGAPAAAELVLALVAPIVAAAGVAGTYRSTRDPVAELVAATPTDPRLLLLVRLALVFGYDLALAFGASVILSATGGPGAASLATLVGAWLGPMALLSSLSLLVAVFTGPDVALGAAATLWAVRVLVGGVLVGDGLPGRLVLEAWSTNPGVLSLSVAVAVAAVALVGRVEPRDGRPATHPT